MNENGNIFVFANQKGGVTKSTSSANLAAALSKKGKKVLYIDMDPQGNGSSIIGFQPCDNENFVSTYDLVIGNSSIKGEHDFVREAKCTNLFLIPSSPDLYNPDAELAGKFTAVYSLRKIVFNELIRGKDKKRFSELAEYLASPVPEGSGLEL